MDIIVKTANILNNHNPLTYSTVSHSLVSYLSHVRGLTFKDMAKKTKVQTLEDLSTFDVMLSHSNPYNRTKYYPAKIRISCARKSEMIKAKIKRDFNG